MKSYGVFLDSSRETLIVLPHTAVNETAFGEPIQADFATLRHAERWCDNANATMNAIKALTKRAHGANCAS